MENDDENDNDAYEIEGYHQNNQSYHNSNILVELQKKPTPKFVNQDDGKPFV
jgi:hypothetical protein